MMLSGGERRRVTIGVELMKHCQLMVLDEATTGHVLLCGYGRVGQNLMRYLTRFHHQAVAIDTDLVRLQEASQAGERIIFGDATRKEILERAGIHRASLLVITFDDARQAERILHTVHQLCPDLRVLVRTRDDTHLDELIQAGAIGPVTEVHTWVSRAWGWQSKADAKKNRDIMSTQDTPKKGKPVPEILDWDLWIGPAPHRPFHSDYFPGPRWYRWWDFGNGTMSDLGSHRNDLPWWALKLDAPLTIEPLSGPKPHHDIAPASMSVKYTFGARGDGYPALEHTWYQGTEKPKIWREGGIPKWGNATLFIGEDGMLLSDYGKHILLPEKKFKDFKRPPRSIAPSPGQQAEWIRACKGEGPEPLCHFAYAGPLTEANHLGNVAYRAGKKLEWDAKNMKIPNAPEAEKFLGRSYREGWKLA